MARDPSGAFQHALVRPPVVLGYPTPSPFRTHVHSSCPIEYKYTPFPGDILVIRALVTFVRRVPRGVLVKASMRVRAYTRALRYLEEQIRAEHSARQKSTGQTVSFECTRKSCRRLCVLKASRKGCGKRFESLTSYYSVRSRKVLAPHSALHFRSESNPWTPKPWNYAQEDLIPHPVRLPQLHYR